MATKTINVDMLAKMFLAGAQNIEAKKEYINELNVFPVPDGDTGTNMSLTIMAAAKEVTALTKPDIKDLAKAVSSGSSKDVISKIFIIMKVCDSIDILPGYSGLRNRIIYFSLVIVWT